MSQRVDESQCLQVVITIGKKKGKRNKYEIAQKEDDKNWEEIIILKRLRKYWCPRIYHQNSPICQSGHDTSMLSAPNYSLVVCLIRNEYLFTIVVEDTRDWTHHLASPSFLSDCKLDNSCVCVCVLFLTIYFNMRDILYTSWSLAYDIIHYWLNLVYQL